MDDLLRELTERIKEVKPKLVAEQRLAAYKFLDTAYLYTGKLHETDEPLDPWEDKLVFALNYAVGLPKDSDRDELRREIAYAREVLEGRIKHDPAVSAAEQRVFEIVEQFSLVGDLA